MDAKKIDRYYRLRFQIEFLIRDAKQYSGLEHGQARDKNKLHFHFNLSLTNVNIAKAQYHLSKPRQERGAFSLQDIKRMHYNRLITDFILENLGADLKCKKIKKLYAACANFGKLAA
jgi:IS4 transposase